MRRLNRKTSPKVVGGLTLRKNNHKLTSNYWNTVQEEVVIDSEKPGRGYKHFLKKRDILKFIETLPNWNEISVDLDAIVLIAGEWGLDGYYNNDGVICICAWEKEMDRTFSQGYFNDHKELFERLGVKSKKIKGEYFCEFNEDQIKAFQLLHILLHEIGHHVDRINTRSKRTCSRGEKFAEDYAFEHEAIVWERYQNEFKVVLG